MRYGGKCETYVVGDCFPGVVAGHAGWVGGWVAAAAGAQFVDGAAVGGGEQGACEGKEGGGGDHDEGVLGSNLVRFWEKERLESAQGKVWTNCQEEG